MNFHVGKSVVELVLKGTQLTVCASDPKLSLIDIYVGYGGK